MYVGSLNCIIIQTVLTVVHSTFLCTLVIVFHILLDLCSPIIHISPLSPLQLLVNHPRTDINLKSDGGVTPLIAAVKVVNQFMVNQLLKKNVDIGTTDKDGRTAVHWAAMVDNLEALKLLIRQGPDAIKDAQDSKVRDG